MYEAGQLCHSCKSNLRNLPALTAMSSLTTCVVVGLGLSLSSIPWRFRWYCSPISPISPPSRGPSSWLLSFGTLPSTVLRADNPKCCLDSERAVVEPLAIRKR